MKKILQINTVSNSGSTGRIAEGIARCIVAQNWESYIAYGRHSNDSQYSEEILIGNKIDFYIHAVGTRLFDSHGFFSKSATQDLIKKIELISPDIIHLHNIHGYFINIKILFDYIKKKNIPIVWTLHDCWTYTGHCAYYSHVDCNLWKTECHNCPQIQSYPKSFTDFSKRNYNIKKELFKDIENLVIVTPSNWLAAEVKESFLKDYDIKVINNGINLEKFDIKPTIDIKKKFGLIGQKVILGVASIWEPRKGFDDFIALNDEMKDYNFKIIMVGLSDDQIKNLPKNIIGIKRTESIEEMATLYSLADVFFNPTYEDNFPTTNIEALACGTPVITYKTGGSPEIIDNKTGWVFEKGDLEGVKSLLLSLDNEKSNSLICRARAESLYQDQTKFNEYIEVYKKKLA